MIFNLHPLSANPGINPLEFEWDEASGTVTGASADVIRSAAAEFGVPLHPAPAFHRFSANPLKSRADMAAIIGHLHQLPAELAHCYPTVDDAPETVEVLDSGGRIVEKINMVF